MWHSNLPALSMRKNDSRSYQNYVFLEISVEKKKDLLFNLLGFLPVGNVHIVHESFNLLLGLLHLLHGPLLLPGLGFHDFLDGANVNLLQALLVLVYKFLEIQIMIKLLDERWQYILSNYRNLSNIVQYLYITPFLTLYAT